MDPLVNSTGAGSSSDYRKKRIKNVQKLELVRLMKANFLFIRGKHAVARCEKSRADIWQMITARLNSLGPPVQSAEAWQRRWNDMRSATKSKMTKIQSYVRDHGENCPYRLNLVERLIWDTFCVKPEEYMKDLNMKLWREKQQLESNAFVPLYHDGVIESGATVDEMNASVSQSCSNEAVAASEEPNRGNNRDGYLFGTTGGSLDSYPCVSSYQSYGTASDIVGEPRGPDLYSEQSVSFSPALAHCPPNAKSRDGQTMAERPAEHPKAWNLNRSLLDMPSDTHDGLSKVGNGLENLT
uniref:Regulatory protein zeste n=1 Tax=Anopheles darlingi TaxID=43151 RepID=A0A2K6VB12_ANODA